jgi:hypothetical protein
LSDIPNSIKVFSDGKLVSNTLYFFDFISSSIIFNNTHFENIKIEYRAFNYNFKQNISHKDTNLTVPKLNSFDNQNRYSANKTIDDFVNSDGLTKRRFFERYLGW